MRKLDLLAGDARARRRRSTGVSSPSPSSTSSAAVFGLEFGETNAATRIVYGLVGLAAVYGIGALHRATPCGGDASPPGFRRPLTPASKRMTNTEEDS